MDTILILTPVKDALPFLDDTFSKLGRRIPELERRFRRVGFLRPSNGTSTPLPAAVQVEQGHAELLAEYYHDADLVVIPLRAGGGTRIKMLEAFGYRRPVVSTACGAEGIDVRHEVHLLLADAPEDIAKECVRLMEIPSLGQGLAERAFEFVRANHSPERIRELLRRDHRSA